MRSSVARWLTPWLIVVLCGLVLAYPITGSASDPVGLQADHDAPAPACRIAAGETALDAGTLHYQFAGTGPRVLLLHGLFASKEQWDALLCRLADAGYTAVAPDLPGFGASQGFPLADHALERQVERLREFLTRLEVSRLHLAGNSMGGAVAALYARTYPDQVATLALLGAPLGAGDWSAEVKAAILQGINPFIPVTPAELDLELGLLFAEPPALDAELKAALVRDYVERNRHYQQVWTIVGLYPRVLLDGAPWHRTPTLILWGTAERIFDLREAAALRQQFPRGHWVSLPRAGHLPHLEQDAATAAAYLRFLRAYGAR